MHKFSSKVALGLILVLVDAMLTSNLVEGGDKGSDIILAKGKLIVRGGKDKGMYSI